MTRTTVDLVASEAEVQAWRAEAERHSLSLSAWARLVLNAAPMTRRTEQEATRDVRVQILAVLGEWTTWKKLADRAGLSVSAWVRLSLNREAEKPRVFR